MEAQAAADWRDYIVLALSGVFGLVLLVVLYKAALRFDRWAESRGLRWHWLGLDILSWYLWPEVDGRDGRQRIAGALLAVLTVLVVAAVFGVYLVLELRQP